MKSIVTIFQSVMISNKFRRNTRLLIGFSIILIVMVFTYTTLFHYIMEHEGQDHSWISGLYWTLVTMSTLGFGDITFQSDTGRFFSVIVLLSGTIMLLVILPFTFIQFFYEPLLQAQSLARAPRQLSVRTKNHVVLTNYDDISAVLIDRLKRNGIPYVLLTPDIQKALEYADREIRVMVGDYDLPQTYLNARIEKARYVVSTGKERINTAISFTVREVNDRIPIISTTDSQEAKDILLLAGSNHVIEPSSILGETLAQRAGGGKIHANRLARYGKVLIVESTCAGTELVGKSLEENQIHARTGVQIVGIWERGDFLVARPDTVLLESHVLILAGSSEQIQSFEQMFSPEDDSDSYVLIIGGGRVGVSAASLLEARGIDYGILEKNHSARSKNKNVIYGNAEELDTLQMAGIDRATSVIITTHEDPTNIYLTIYCRKLRPDIQILSRSNLERNVSTIYRAGADFVISLSSLGASMIYNRMTRDGIYLVSERLQLFREKVPPEFAGRSLKESALRQKTGCSLVALELDGQMTVNPPSSTPLILGSEMILIGPPEAEKLFIDI